MPRYLLLYRVMTPLQHAQDVALEKDGCIVHFLFSRREAQESTVLAQVELEAPNYREAQSLAASSLIPPMLDALAFVTGAPLLLGECELTLKDQTGLADRRGIYVGQNALHRAIPLADDAAEHVRAILNAAGPVALPLCWLRYSHHRDLTIEKFVFAWLGFEELAGDIDITSNCNDCGAANTHRGANRQRGWELFHAANPAIERGEFDREIWGRARNSLFHGGRYPAPAFLASLRTITLQVQSSVERELRAQLNLEAGWQPPNQQEHIFRVFLGFGWQTNTPDVAFPVDWPRDQLDELVQDAQPDGRMRVAVGPLLRNLAEFEGW